MDTLYITNIILIGGVVSDLHFFDFRAGENLITYIIRYDSQYSLKVNKSKIH